MTMAAQLKAETIWIHEPKEGFVLVTPEMAARWRVEHHYHGQRVFRPWHCSNLVDMMKKGIFRPKTQIAFVRLKGRLYCTNGQHTLAAIELSGIPQLISIVINDASNEQELADDFARHDTHLTRQFADSLVAHDVHADLGVTSTALNNIAAACIFYEQMLGETTVRGAQMLTHDEKLRIVRKHGELGVIAWRFFEGAYTKKYLVRRTTLAPAMACAAQTLDLAESFWVAIAMDDGLRSSDPRKTLLEWLRTRSTVGGRFGNVNASGKVAADHELVKGISVAWNAWVRGDDLKMIKVNFDAPTATFANVGTFVVKGKKK